MKLILFHSNQISLRGTEIALYDYAHFNEIILGNRSHIVFPANAYIDKSVKEKFEKRFQLHFYQNFSEVESLAKSLNANLFYAIKAGFNDKVLLQHTPTAVHAVFKYYEPHGDYYAYISPWLSKEMSDGVVPVVPHMVNLPSVNGDLREELGIPEDSIVFGRYGGSETFDIPFVLREVFELSIKHSNIHFIFMNTDFFLDKIQFSSNRIFQKVYNSIIYKNRSLSNIHFLEGTPDPLRKVKFIQTCDAMLHARLQGESFGLACGEFSILNKPVITCNHSMIRERCHIDILGSRGLYYQDAESLHKLLLSFKKTGSKNWDAYSEAYNPESVMKEFERVFLVKKI